MRYEILILILLAGCLSPTQSPPESQSLNLNLSFEEGNESFAEEPEKEKETASIEAIQSWNFSTGEPVYDLEVGEDYIAVASYDNHFYLLSRGGKMLQSIETRGNAEAVALEEGRGLMVGASFVHPLSTLYLYSLEERKVVWERNFTAQVRGLDTQGDKIIAGDTSGRVSFYSLQGRSLGNFSLGESAWGAWEVEAGEEGICIASDDTYLYYLSGERPEWKKSMGRKHYLYGCAIEETQEMVGAASQGNRAIVYSLEGSPRWSFTTNFSNRDIAISRYGTVAVASWDGHVYLLSREGHLQGSIEIREPTSLSFYNRTLGVGSRDGRAYFYHLEEKDLMP